VEARRHPLRSDRWRDGRRVRHPPPRRPGSSCRGSRAGDARLATLPTSPASPRHLPTVTRGDIPANRPCGSSRPGTSRTSSGSCPPSSTLVAGPSPRPPTPAWRGRSWRRAAGESAGARCDRRDVGARTGLSGGGGLRRRATRQVSSHGCSHSPTLIFRSMPGLTTRTRRGRTCGRRDRFDGPAWA
jgi:hypothetical protein